MEFDPSAWWARAALAFAIGQCAACGGFSSGNGGTGDDGGPAQEASANDGGTGTHGSEEAGDDGTTTAPEPCSNVGAVRPCTAASGPSGAQTCGPGPQGTPVWGACFSLACDATAQPQPGEACVPAGTFTMGGLDGDAGTLEDDTLPAHTVTIRRRFYVDQFEVSYGDFMKWWNASPRPVPAEGATVYVTGSGETIPWHQPTGGLQPLGTQMGDGCVAASMSGASQYPVNCVTWETALAYCMAEGKRLPTEAEWEWAATGQGAGNEYPWGSASPDCSHAIFGIPSSTCMWPQTIGSVTAGNTLLGALNDMAGDEAEWTLDFYPAFCHATNTCWPTYQNDPVNTTDGSKGYVLRGGSWTSSADMIRTRARDTLLSSSASTAGNAGFRCARDER